MSIKRILAVCAIFALTTAGWWILGSATAVRSTNLFHRLGDQVQELWGIPLTQKAPSFAAEIPGTDQLRWLMPEKNDIHVQLNTDYRKKGLIWYPTYTCSFAGTYTIRNTEDVQQKIRIHFDFPAKGATYDDFAIESDGETLRLPVNTEEGITEIIELAPTQARDFKITYRTRGIREWRYSMDQSVGRVQNLNLTVKTNFKDIDFPDGSLSPMHKATVAGGTELAWSATDLITREDIGIIIPEKLNPGPLTTRITFFAPVCLLFFFTLVATINILYKINIHPMHYLFVAAGFFAFHLLLSYMTGIVNIHIAFIIAAITSVSLVTGYLSAALGGQFPRKVAIAGQLFFLVLFSYSFFLKGITGLTVAIGSVVTLGVLMKVTAHTDWTEVFSKTNCTNTTPPKPVLVATPITTHPATEAFPPSDA